MEDYATLSLWVATTPSTKYPSLKEDLGDFDVVVIGGGIAGVTAATRLKEAGQKVALIDLKGILEGVTGNTTAKITSQHGLIYSRLIKHFGEKTAEAYGRANQEALEYLAREIEKKQIDCGFRRAAAFVYAQDEESYEKVKEEVWAARSIGLPASLTNKVELPFEIKGAIRFDHQAYFHPRKYLLASAKLIPGSGSFVFEATKALKVEEDARGLRVKTDRGIISARHCLITSHHPLNSDAAYYSKMHYYRSYVIAAVLKDKVPADMYISYGADNNYRSFRPHEEGDKTYLIFGGERHHSGEDIRSAERYQRLEKDLRQMLSVEEVAYRWSAQDNFPFDNIPLIGRYRKDSRRLWVATGFQGWGMTTGTTAGILLSDLVMGKANPWESLYNPHRASSFTEIGDYLGLGKSAVKNLISRRLKKELPVTAERGQIIDRDGKKVALYRDNQGHKFMLSASCTHKGCIVNWNEAEKTWDCPCHGSRFNAQGGVIQGPATDDLASI